MGAVSDAVSSVGDAIGDVVSSVGNAVEDVGNAKVQTTSPSFAILPRTPLFFTGVAARLTSANAGASSAAFGLTKRVRPVVRWKNQYGQLIREERPAYDIIFPTTSYTSTVVYLGPASPTQNQGEWQTGPAPSNAAFFDVAWELLYMDGTDIVDLDVSNLQYFPYISNGGNGADGLAIIRWFDKTSV